MLILTGQSLPERKPDRTVRMTAERFHFTPSRFTVKQGELVELVITSEDTDHGFHLPATNIDAAVPPQHCLIARLTS